MTRARTSGHFLDGAKGPIFVLLREPARPDGRCALVLPPFGEEMNKSRRMLAQVSSGLALRGVASVLPDLYGTGDSFGELADADWDGWIGDVRATVDWARERGYAVDRLLAVRLGCALAAQAAETGAIPPVSKAALWQPVFDGERFLNQFLRLRIAATLMSEDRKETLAGLRGRLRAGETLEVAGYPLRQSLVEGIDALKPGLCLPAELGAVQWCEVVREAGADLPAPSAALVEASRAAGSAVSVRSFAGDPFWSATEIVVLPEMVSATIEHLAAAPDPASAADASLEVHAS